MNIQFILNKALTTPPHIFIKKIYSVLLRKTKHSLKKRKDFIRSTFQANKKIKIPYSYLDVKGLNRLHNTDLIEITKCYFAHRFDLLGSGWVEYSYDGTAIGVEGNQYNQNAVFDIEHLILRSNTKYAKKVYEKVDKEYQPIDWQKDFKSGFRWSAKVWYLNQRNTLQGVDIKVPWEIGRLQHLPQLALACSSSDAKRTHIKEFKNQIYDFIALNPPRFGVQWTCTMDVGIRVANMLLSYDLFLKMDDENILDDQFKEIFSRSVYEHGIHIVNNLEYNENLTSNHYLSDIVGLLFAASYLERNEETDIWLGFSVQEVINEMQKQFYEEGSNFEASTSYHRLSTELMVYATALILGLDTEKCEALQYYKTNQWKVSPMLKQYTDQAYSIVEGEIVLPQWFIARLYKAGIFTKNITKPTGEIVQFGDNDSGRFFRLSPNGKWLSSQEAKNKYNNLEGYPLNNELFWDENILDHQTLLAAMRGLFESNEFDTKFGFETEVVALLAKKRKLPIPKYENISQKQVTVGFENLACTTKKVFDIPVKDEKSLLDNLQFVSYQETGIYILKSDRVYLAVSAGSNGQKGNGGHAHNDKLSFELNIDDNDVIIDAGTYLYTPLPEKRNQFRSTKAHNTLIIQSEEQNVWIEGRYGLFSMKNQSRCYLVDYGESFIDVAVEYKDIKQRRKFMVEEAKIVIENYSNKPFTEYYNDFKLYSNGYGKLVNSSKE